MSLGNTVGAGMTALGSGMVQKLAYDLKKSEAENMRRHQSDLQEAKLSQEAQQHTERIQLEIAGQEAAAARDKNQYAYQNAQIGVQQANAADQSWSNLTEIKGMDEFGNPTVNGYSSINSDTGAVKIYAANGIDLLSHQDVNGNDLMNPGPGGPGPGDPGPGGPGPGNKPNAQSPQSNIRETLARENPDASVEEIESVYLKTLKAYGLEDDRPGKYNSQPEAGQKPEVPGKKPKSPGIIADATADKDMFGSVTGAEATKDPVPSAVKQEKGMGGIDSPLTRAMASGKSQTDKKEASLAPIRQAVNSGEAAQIDKISDADLKLLQDSLPKRGPNGPRMRAKIQRILENRKNKS